MPTKILKLKSQTARGVALAAALVAVVFAFSAARWLFANTIATRSQYKEIAEFAAALGPSDPQTHLTFAVLLEKTFFPEDLPQSLTEFETAVALSPFDFNLWLELGRARDRAGDAAGAEKALRRALQLAPNYARVAWTLGNFLLRQERTDEAFELIRRACDSDAQYANPAVASAWQVFGGDIGKLRELAGGSRNLRASLASYLAREKRFDESVEIWRTLSEEDRNVDLKANGDEIRREMLAANRYRDAAGMSAGQFRSGVLHNGDFEGPFTLQSPSIFEWRIGDGSEPQVAVDPAQKHDGNLSLVLVFNSSDGASFRGLSQTVALEPGRAYQLKGYYRSDLKASATVKWSISTAADGKVVGESSAIDPKADWTEFSVLFTVPTATDGVIIGLQRSTCTSPICPITGKVWFDSMKITEIETKKS